MKVWYKKYNILNHFIIEIKNKEKPKQILDNDGDEDKDWDEYDDGDEEDLSDENEGNKNDEKNNENKSYQTKDYYSGDYRGYNNYNYRSKRHRKKNAKAKKNYFSKEQEQHYTKPNYKFNYESSQDFMNTNSNYMKKSNSEPFNNKNYNYNPYSKGRTYSNRNHWNNYYGGEKKEENELSKPMFTNSKLENNGNPEGNFIKLENEGKSINLQHIGEVPINSNEGNSVLMIKSLLTEKKSDNNDKGVKENSNEKIKEDENTQFNQNNIDTNSLPWRSGQKPIGAFGERAGGYKKDNFNKNYWNYKKNNSFYYNYGKNYNGNRYTLNQPQSKKMNKFD